MNIGGTVFGDLSGKDVRLGGSGAVSQTERLAITKANADSSEITSIETTGSNGAKSRTFVGTRNPDDTVSAAAGSLYVRVNGTRSALFVNTSSATGTTWSTVGAQLAYAPGSITIPAGHFRQHTRRIQMTGSQRLTAAGDARFSCYN